METWQIIGVFTIGEAAAIRYLADKPRPDWVEAVGAASSANLLSLLVMLAVQPIVATHWDATLQHQVSFPTGEALLAWFCAFTIANAIELSMLKWVWRIELTKSLSIAISLANAWAAYQDIYKILWHDS